MRWSVLVLLCLASTLTVAQESPLAAELRREGERASDACHASFMSVGGCAYTLFTDHPLHIAAGSMPPQNGFGLGAAFVANRNTQNWRLSWNVDAVAATSGSWRAGGYVKVVHTPVQPIHVSIPSSTAAGQPGTAKKHEVRVHPYTVFNLYAQSISLNKLNYFGLGNDSSPLGKSVFGMTQTIVGGNVTKPVFEW